ncbi:MAG TPA: RDD family protein [Bacteroides reticulotermitis]|nr:RDD family protein [Bacteroides reticulotermitis]
MADSTIITGQFVRISQTPASIGERIIALFIDYFLIVVYLICMTTLITKFRINQSSAGYLFFLLIGYLPVLFYSFLCEIFNRGQSFGKKLMNIRVVKADGSTPSIGSYLLRWLLFLIDGPATGGMGLLVVLLTKNNQRIGDLAAGTMVIKEKNYRKIHVSLDEFDYLTQNYHPVYPQSADLSLEQVNVITRTLESGEKDRTRRVTALAKKVQELLSVTPRDGNQEKFLQTVLRDYQYYALEEI